MLAQVLTCIGASAAIFLSYTLLVVVRTEPWYSPQYFIPILGKPRPESGPLHPMLCTKQQAYQQLCFHATATHRNM